MDFFIYGAGRAGRSIARLLKSNHQIKLRGIYNRNPLPVEIKKNLKGINIYTGKDLGEIYNATHIIFAISDIAIPEISWKLYNEGKIHKNQFWFHLSGILSSDVLKIDNTIPQGVCAIHPFQSMAIFPQDIKILKKSYFIIEGDKKGIEEAKKILNLMKLKHLPIDKDLKPLYHCACVISSNFFVLLNILAEEILKKCGFNGKKAEEMVLPILEGTLKNMKKLGFHRSLTGPIQRGDVETIKKHINALQKYYPDAIKFYKSFIPDNLITLIKT